MTNQKNRAALGAIILIVLILIGDLASGLVGVSSPRQKFGCIFDPVSKLGCQSGNCPTTGVCTAITISAGNLAGNAIVTFPSAFSKAPQVNPPWIRGTGSSSGRQISVIIPFIQGLGQTWNNMPAAATELFGNNLPAPCCELFFNNEDWGNTGEGCDFWANVIVPSNSATATIYPEYTVDNGVNWIILGSGISIANAGLFITPTAIPSSPTIILLRVSGLNGGGVLDNPQFGTIAFTCYGPLYSAITMAISTLPGPSATSFRVNVVLGSPAPTTLTINFGWTAITN